MQHNMLDAFASKIWLFSPETRVSCEAVHYLEVLTRGRSLVHLRHKLTRFFHCGFYGCTARGGQCTSEKVPEDA